MKITDGCLETATMNRVRTSFSASPTCLTQEKAYQVNIEDPLTGKKLETTGMTHRPILMLKMMQKH